MITPRRIGRFLPLDADGYIVPDVAHENIGAQWQTLIDYVVHALMGAGPIHAIYIRGSVPRGLAIEHVSDIDFIYIADDDFTAVEQAIQQQASKHFPFTSKVDFLCISRTDLERIHPPEKRPFFHMLLKTQSLFLAGNDITRTIDPFKPGLELASHAFALPYEFKTLPQRPNCQEPETRKWFCKRILRAGLEITLDRSPLFTRDLYLCYEQFAQFYPAYDEQMRAALLNSLNGHEDSMQYGGLINLIGAEHNRLMSRAQ